MGLLPASSSLSKAASVHASNQSPVWHLLQQSKEYRKMDFQCFQFSKRWELPTQDSSSSSFFGVCVFLCAKKIKDPYSVPPPLYSLPQSAGKRRREFNSTSANITGGEGKNLTLLGQYMFSCLGENENSTFRFSSLLRANVVRAGFSSLRPPPPSLLGA